MVAVPEGITEQMMIDIIQRERALNNGALIIKTTTAKGGYPMMIIGTRLSTKQIVHPKICFAPVTPVIGAEEKYQTCVLEGRRVESLTPFTRFTQAARVTTAKQFWNESKRAFIPSYLWWAEMFAKYQLTSA